MVNTLTDPRGTRVTRRPQVALKKNKNKLLHFFSSFMVLKPVSWCTVSNMFLLRSGQQSPPSGQWQTTSHRQRAVQETKCDGLISSLNQSMAFSSSCVTGFYLLTLKNLHWMGLKEPEKDSCDCRQQELRHKWRCPLLSNTDMLSETYFQSLSPPLPHRAVLPLILENKIFPASQVDPRLKTQHD